jgi:hypothetical protein
LVRIPECERPKIPTVRLDDDGIPVVDFFTEARIITRRFDWEEA